MNTVEAVECAECGRLYKIDSDKFVSVHGNVCRGLGGGIIGNNLDNTGKVNRVVFYCYPHCIAKVLNLNLSTTR